MWVPFPTSGLHGNNIYYTHMYAQYIHNIGSEGTSLITRGKLFNAYSLEVKHKPGFQARKEANK